MSYEYEYEVSVHILYCVYSVYVKLTRRIHSYRLSIHIKGLLSYFTGTQYTIFTHTSSRNMPNRFQTRPLHMKMMATGHCVCQRVSIFPMKERKKNIEFRGIQRRNGCEGRRNSMRTGVGYGWRWRLVMSDGWGWGLVLVKAGDEDGIEAC